MQYFQSRASMQITAPFQFELWNQCVFQLAGQYDFVMSALIALSSMHESYSQAVDNQDHLSADVFRYYNKTIRNINKAMWSDLSVDAVLMTVIILHLIDSMHGSFQNAIKHAQSGIKIIREPLQSSISREESPFGKALYRQFLALQIQVREFGNINMPRAFDGFQAFRPPICDQFSSAEEASHHFEIIYNEIRCLADYLQTAQESRIFLADAYATEIQPRFEMITARFSGWTRGLRQLDVLLAKDSDSRQRQACLVLRMYKSLFAAMQSSFPSGECFRQIRRRSLHSFAAC